MTKTIMVSLFLGIALGYGHILPPSFTNHLHVFTDCALFIAVFSVGMDLGCNRNTLQEIRQWGWKILLLPLSAMVGSIVLSSMVSPLLKIPMRESAAIVSGFGWYSLAGAMLTHLAGPYLGTTAFLANLLREIFTFFSVEWIYPRFGGWATVALGGATSMDTTLGLISETSEGRLNTLSLTSGVLHSLAVPIFIPLWIKMP